MSRRSMWLKRFGLLAVGSVLWMWGAGTCVPFNFYADLLGNTIITGVTTAVLDTALTAVGLST